MVANIHGGKSAERPTFKVGDRVRVPLGLQTYPGTIVEDRGLLSSGGRRLYRVKVEFDPPNTTFIEFPEEELTAAQQNPCAQGESQLQGLGYLGRSSGLDVTEPSRSAVQTSFWRGTAKQLRGLGHIGQGLFVKLFAVFAVRR